MYILQKDIEKDRVVCIGTINHAYYIQHASSQRIYSRKMVTRQKNTSKIKLFRLLAYGALDIIFKIGIEKKWERCKWRSAPLIKKTGIYCNC